MKLYVCERAHKHKACLHCWMAEPHKVETIPMYCHAARKKLACIPYQEPNLAAADALMRIFGFKRQEEQ